MPRAVQEALDDAPDDEVASGARAERLPKLPVAHPPPSLFDQRHHRGAEPKKARLDSIATCRSECLEVRTCSTRCMCPASASKSMAGGLRRSTSRTVLNRNRGRTRLGAVGAPSPSPIFCAFGAGLQVVLWSETEADCRVVSTRVQDKANWTHAVQKWNKGY